MSPLLAETEIRARIECLPDWSVVDGRLERIAVFPDFARAMNFVNSIARLAEEANHHPDIGIRWNKVLLTLCTHSAGGLTALDFDLARRIKQLL